MSSSTTMQSSVLSSLARSKLLTSFTKENGSLHRWVLLKNSLIRANPLATSATSSSSDRSDTHNVYAPDERDVEDEFEFEETDSFMFPDAEKLGNSKESYSNASEAAWLDSLLESLGDDDDDDFNVDSDVSISTLPIEDDDESLSPLISPLISPMSSSDDLVNQPYYPPPIAAPYPVPYPPYHPPLIRSCEHVSVYPTHQVSSSPSLPPPSSSPVYDDPLPYHDMDDVEDLSVPDAIEDTSDDESDALTTPSATHSSSMLSFIDPASIPLPAERRRRRQRLQVYIEPEDTFFYPFELDPLPFSHQFNSYGTLCQEC